MKNKTNLKAAIPTGWRLADVFGDEDLVLTDDEQTVWVDRNGFLYVGGPEGEDVYGVPADLLPALYEIWTAMTAEAQATRSAAEVKPQPKGR